jgi:copper(I)-binding protein
MFRVLLASCAALLVATATHALQFSVGDLIIDRARSRATAAGMPVGVAYLSITNNGAREEVLLAARTSVAERVEFHRTTMDAGMARMRPSGSLKIAPKSTLTAEPGGLHLMLIGLTAPLVAGTYVPLVLTFESAGEVTVQLLVERP